MKLEKCLTGMVYVVGDRRVHTTSHTGCDCHNYLIIDSGCNNKYGSPELLQAMSITSMRNKNISMEVPIVLTNGYISYIVPYNIHSLHWDDIDLSKFKGCITDTDLYSKNDFIQLLKDIYYDSKGINPNRSHEEIVDAYNDYCDKFFQTYADKTEYRNKKVYKKSKPYQKPYNSNTKHHRKSQIRKKH